MKTNLLIIVLSLMIFGQADAQQIIRIKSEKQAITTESDLPAAPDLPKKENPDPVPQTQNPTYVRPDADKRFKRYVKHMFGPVSLGTKVLTSGYHTAINSPEEWGGTWEGFGKRFASSVGKGIIRETTVYTLD